VVDRVDDRRRLVDVRERAVWRRGLDREQFRVAAEARTPSPFVVDPAARDETKVPCP